MPSRLIRYSVVRAASPVPPKIAETRARLAAEVAVGDGQAAPATAG